MICFFIRLISFKLDANGFSTHINAFLCLKCLISEYLIFDGVHMKTTSGFRKTASENELKILIAYSRLFNYHAANLPEERGAGNLTWKILQRNFKKNTINIHKVDKEFDTGDIVASKKLKFILLIIILF